jgi:hypothetical protein
MASSKQKRNQSNILALLVIAVCFAVLCLSQSNTDDRVLLTEDELPYEEPVGLAHSTTMLLGIFTDQSERQRVAREDIRSTYLQEKDRDPRICKLSEYMKQHRDSNVVCRIAYVFVIGADPDRPTDHDDDALITIDPAVVADPVSDDQDDIVYLNIAENTDNGKSATYFKWASSIADSHAIDYVAKSPTTTLIDKDLMLQFMNKDLAPFPYNRRTYGGSTWGGYANSLVFADKAFYFVSRDLAAFIGFHLTAKERKMLSSRTGATADEARDIGTFIYAHPKFIKFLFLSQYQFWHAPLNSSKEWHDAWENKMDELPIRGPLIPLHGICEMMHRVGDFKLPGEETQE